MSKVYACIRFQTLLKVHNLELSYTIINAQIVHYTETYSLFIHITLDEEY